MRLLYLALSLIMIACAAEVSDEKTEKFKCETCCRLYRCYCETSTDYDGPMGQMSPRIYDHEDMGVVHANSNYCAREASLDRYTPYSYEDVYDVKCKCEEDRR